MAKISKSTVPSHPNGKIPWNEHVNRIHMDRPADSI